jgi:hypothetical protein
MTDEGRRSERFAASKDIGAGRLGLERYGDDDVGAGVPRWDRVPSDGL